MENDIKTILAILLLSNAFVGLIEIAISARFMSRCEDWQRVGMLVCGITIMVLVSWQALNIFTPEIVGSLIPNSVLRLINIKWFNIVTIVENFLFGVILYTVVSKEG